MKKQWVKEESQSAMATEKEEKGSGIKLEWTQSVIRPFPVSNQSVSDSHYRSICAVALKRRGSEWMDGCVNCVFRLGERSKIKLTIRGYGTRPNEKISHRRIPYDHTSLLDENRCNYFESRKR